MRNQIYLQAKSQIEATCKELKGNTDQPYRRLTLNDLLDNLTREINFEAFKERISQRRADLYINWLTNYVIRRHNK